MWSGERRRSKEQWLPWLGLLAAWTALAWAGPARGQMSPEEHAKHHPGQATGKAEGIPPFGPKAGMMDGMGGMEGMHGGMSATPPKESYPSLMSLPELTPEKRAEVERQADERMSAGTALMSQGLDRLSEATAKDDYAAMQEATAQLREGLALFESGVAARHALAEGKAPRDIALQWFKGEMNLSAPPAGQEAAGGPFGLSWFHFLVMVILVGFVAVMLWMYFHKMRRATELLKRLTAEAPPAGAAQAKSEAPVRGEA
jgi:hypothetical protein